MIATPGITEIVRKRSYGGMMTTHLPPLYADDDAFGSDTSPGFEHTMIGPVVAARLPAGTPTATRIPYAVRYPPKIDPPLTLVSVPIVDALDEFDFDDAVVVDIDESSTT